MQIHRVASGDTLWTIAQATGSTPQELMSLNGLASQTELVPGLNLLAPGPTAVVPQARTNKRTIEVNGYLVPSGPQDAATVQNVAPHLTYLCIFSYQAQASGGLTPENDTIALQAAKNGGVRPLMTVTNFDGNNFNPDLAHAVMSDQTIRSQLIANILRTVSEKGFAGVNVDFEHMHPMDRALYDNFIRTLATALHERGLSISIAMGPKTSDEPNQPWMGAFNYQALGLMVDFIMLMTYEWGWVGGPPMAIAPIDQVRAVLNYATSVIDPGKILMGMTLYGYDWPLPHPAAGLASGISDNNAQNLAIRTGSPVEWSTSGESPYFNYRASDGRAHQVWFEDAQSVADKFELVYEMNLRGVSYWVLGNNFPQNWALLGETFVTKRF